MQAENIDSEVVWRNALTVERVDTANLTEEVTGCLGVELIFGERFFTHEQFELALVYLDHQRVLAAADGTVAHRKFGEVGLDLEADGSTMAAAFVLSNGATIHCAELLKTANV